ncbi:hypothetical protein LguiB_004505 [Lonicera macranthoides]
MEVAEKIEGDNNKNTQSREIKVELNPLNSFSLVGGVETFHIPHVRSLVIVVTLYSEIRDHENLSETTCPLNPLPLVAVTGRASDSGATLILSRKKVMIPQPAKKLFIKLIKGLSSVFLS